MKVRLLFCSAIAAALAQSAAASTITYLGTDTSTGAAWRSTSVAKSDDYDINYDDAYGSDGYYVYGQPSGGSTGILSSLPSYITGVTVASGLTTYASSSWEYPMDDPTQSIASSVADLANSGIWYKPSGTANTYYDLFTIELAESATFVLTTIAGVDHYTIPANPNYVKVTSGSASATSDAMSVSSSGLKYNFFELSGEVNDTFTISIMRASNGNVGLAGIAFETVPEPGTMALLGAGLLGLLVYAWRRQK